MSELIGLDRLTGTWPSGIYNIAANDRAMDGPVTRDSSGCVPAEANASGTIDVDKQ